MRFAFFAALAALSFGLLDVRAANAAWTCEGPEYVCGSSHAAPSKASYKKHVAHKSAKAAPSQKVAYSKKSKSTYVSSNSGGSYGGGSSGMASYYWEGQMTASGARFNPNALTAAHRTLPFGTRVLVTNQRTGQSVTVTINDRGPFIKGRIIDLSSAAAGAIGMKSAGVAPVSITVLGKS